MCVRYKWKRGHNAEIFEGIARSFRDISHSRSPLCVVKTISTKSTMYGNIMLLVTDIACTTQADGG